VQRDKRHTLAFQLAVPAHWLEPGEVLGVGAGLEVDVGEDPQEDADVLIGGGGLVGPLPMLFRILSHLLSG
jgi:hypothetical protein